MFHPSPTTANDWLDKMFHWLRAHLDPFHSLRAERDAWRAMAHCAAAFPETARKAGL